MIGFRGHAIVVLTAVTLAALPGEAQWLNYLTPGIPRTADGKPNLAAPAPRTADGKPDFSGLWRGTRAASGETDKSHAGREGPTLGSRTVQEAH